MNKIIENSIGKETYKVYFSSRSVIAFNSSRLSKILTSKWLMIVALYCKVVLKMWGFLFLYICFTSLLFCRLARGLCCLSFVFVWVLLLFNIGLVCMFKRFLTDFVYCPGNEEAKMCSQSVTRLISPAKSGPIESHVTSCDLLFHLNI